MSALRGGALLGLGAVAALLAFPPFGVWPLALVMLAPLAAVVDRVRPGAAFAAAFGYCFSMGVLVVRWLLTALVDEYGVSAGSAWTFLLVVVAACSLPSSAALALAAWLCKRVPDAVAPVCFAAWFTLSEWLRAEPAALPWVMAGQPLAAAPVLIQTAEWGGLHAPGLLAALSGAGVGIALSRRSLRPLAAPAIVLAVATAVGAWCLATSWESGAALRVGVVQASVPQHERFQPGSAARNTQRHADLTLGLAEREAPRLVVWSETAVDTDLEATPGLASLLRRVAGESGALLVTGAPRASDGRRTNSVVVFDSRGLHGVYDKQVLVPFSEYDPEGTALLARLIGPVTEGEGYVAGRVATVFEGEIAFATPICFEITYAPLMRRFRKEGAELIVNLSNDAWFGRTGYAEMHLHHAVFRAVELRTFVVRGANTGISAVVDPAGRVVRWLPAFEEGTLAATVHAAGAPTFYARFGSTPILVTLALVAVGSLALARRRS